MTIFTNFYLSFSDNIKKRKEALIWNFDRQNYFFPDLGTEWDPTFEEKTKCDAFIFFFVAELECYFEQIIENLIIKYETAYTTYFLKHCTAGNSYIENIKAKLRELSKNHNANWKKLEGFFHFIGLKEADFPSDYWNKIEQITTQRGEIAHKGISLSTDKDRRILISDINASIIMTKRFDQNLKKWIDLIDSELARISSFTISFVPDYV